MKQSGVADAVLVCRFIELFCDIKCESVTKCRSCRRGGGGRRRREPCSGGRHGRRARGAAGAALGGMAVSCGEVMYGAYYPYLYGRGAARSFHHAPHFQYDRVSGTATAATERRNSAQ